MGWDTNFAKIDRIGHTEIERFKQKVLSKELFGFTINGWARIFSKKNASELEKGLKALGITDRSG